MATYGNRPEGVRADQNLTLINRLRNPKDFRIRIWLGCLSIAGIPLGKTLFGDMGALFVIVIALHFIADGFAIGINNLIEEASNISTKLDALRTIQEECEHQSALLKIAVTPRKKPSPPGK